MFIRGNTDKGKNQSPFISFSSKEVDWLISQYNYGVLSHMISKKFGTNMIQQSLRNIKLDDNI